MQRIVLLMVCVLSGAGLFAQKINFNQSIGLAATTGAISGSAVYFDSSPSRADYRLRVKTFGLVYAPRFDLVESKDFSISIAAPFMIGFSTTNNYRSVDMRTARPDTTVEGLRGTSFAFELPLVADLNLGLHSASDESKRRFGVYVGAGYVYSYTKVKTTAGKVPFDGWEPMVRAGIRMGQSWENRWSIVLSMRGRFESGGQKIYGLQILKEL